mgnify:CR=1 FL=1
MNLLKKILTTDNHVYAHRSWIVRWESRYGAYSANTKKEAEIFPLEEDAIAFKDALEAAFKLIRHTSGNKVTIEENV